MAVPTVALEAEVAVEIVEDGGREVAEAAWTSPMSFSLPLSLLLRSESSPFL